MTNKEAIRSIRALGLAVSFNEGWFRVNYLNAREATAYYTRDADDALGTAKAMKETAQ